MRPAVHIHRPTPSLPPQPVGLFFLRLVSTQTHTVNMSSTETVSLLLGFQSKVQVLFFQQYLGTFRLGTALFYFTGLLHIFFTFCELIPDLTVWDVSFSLIMVSYTSINAPFSPLTPRRLIELSPVGCHILLLVIQIPLCVLRATPAWFQFKKIRPSRCVAGYKSGSSSGPDRDGRSPQMLSLEHKHHKNSWL